MLRHPNWATRPAPTNGEKLGASDDAVMTMDSARVRAGPSYRSRAIARDSTDAPAAPIACTPRPRFRSGRLDDIAQIIVPRTNSRTAACSTGARPQRSDSGPTTSCPAANTIRKLLSVMARSRGSTPKSSAIAGNAGNIMLVASVPHEARTVSRIINPGGKPSCIVVASWRRILASPVRRPVDAGRGRAFRARSPGPPPPSIAPAPSRVRNSPGPARRSGGPA